MQTDADLHKSSNTIVKLNATLHDVDVIHTNTKQFNCVYAYGIWHTTYTYTRLVLAFPLKHFIRAHSLFDKT